MSVYEVKDKRIISQLFYDWDETLIWSCLQDYMGVAYADDLTNPKSAQIVIADFCFFAGQANKELVCNKPKSFINDFVIMVPQNDSWSKIIEESYGCNSKKVKRYAIKKEKDIFDIDKLTKITNSLQSSFSLSIMDEEKYIQVNSNSWSRDLCSQFKSYEDFKNRGLGVVVTKDNVVVAGASSYTVYKEGIEIEIDTREDYRRRGLALVCGAKIILECIKRNLYPSWDAQNKGSLLLSKKLGYHFDNEYVAYEIINY